ncbi:cyclic nucleotide-binding domain-containing protein [Roseofilum casamattae]|uniref:Cyclic nucleotide-binding domain-containing protein n=1 Tax=Roseofilum casamattae BLCC-M143 TaxID=3022442 RepID=A0ABT7C224_9CYAN|nr:cyclic nucleotide-binding domain-containing protein [Roseofilum casamattae]MDJ1185504.1 cyclic nucleotide-binding domain-containing protein [Roseofilum casamattae BLCC-M143]
MFHRVAERNMHVVRWMLTIGWLLLIASLFYDPISLQLTQPESPLQSFQIDPQQCTMVQGDCVYETPYGLGAQIFWGMVIPNAVILLLVFGHETWRRVCPLSFLSQIPRALGMQRQRKITNAKTGKVRYELAKVKKDSWFGQNHLYLQFVLLCLGLCTRILFVDSNRIALGSFLLLTIVCAIAVGYLYGGKSWCQYFCPMAPVQLVYNGPRSIFGSEAHQGPKQTVTQSMCRTITGDGLEKSACVGCQSPCIDIDAERSYWEAIAKPGRSLVQYGYVGLVIGFYLYYQFYSGNPDYYTSGIWNHDPNQLSQLLQPGFYFSGRAIPIPKLIAAPLTIGTFVAASYFILSWVEKRYKAYRRKINKPLTQSQISHQLFSLCTFAVFNIYFIFAGRPVGQLMIFSSISMLWLYRTFNRSHQTYTRESLANSLRRQLSKLAVDFSQFLEGRSLEELKPDEVYVLATVLPGVNREYGLQVYKGVLEEVLEQGNVDSANSLEMLQQIRQELALKEEDHFQVLTEVGIENPELLDPSKQRSRENQLRLESYRQALELQLLELVEVGVPLAEALRRKKSQIADLEEEYGITGEEEKEVLTKMFDENSATLRKAEFLVGQLKDLLHRYQVLENLVPDPNAPMFVLLRQVGVERKQQLVAKQLLNILELLGRAPETAEIARSTGLLAENVLPNLLENSDGTVPWEQRLPVEVIAWLQPVSAAVDTYEVEPPTILPADGEVLSPLEQRRQAVLQVLADLVGDVDPLVQAISLYALGKLSPETVVSYAEGILQQCQNRYWLSCEVARQILGHGSDEVVKVQTLIARIEAMGKVREEVFQQPVIRLGSSEINEVVLHDVWVHQQHAIFYLDDEGVNAIDLSGTSGLRVGDRLLQSDRLRLQQGDVVRFGQAEGPAITVKWEKRFPVNTTPTEVMTTLDKLLLLFESSFLQSIEPEALVDLARDAVVKIYRKGEYLCQEGDPSDEILVLIDGSANVTIQQGDRAVAINQINIGESIGEMGTLTRQRRSASVVAAGETNRVLVVTAKSFEALLAKDPELARNLLLIMSGRLQRLTSTVQTQSQ